MRSKFAPSRLLIGGEWRAPHSGRMIEIVSPNSESVVGIVAGRLKDRHHRPVFVFARADGTELRGSGRSIPGLHLRDAL